MKTEDLLFEMGLTPDYAGYYYLTDLINRRRENINNNNISPVYQVVNEYAITARKFNVTTNAVERCIRYAIETLYAGPLHHSPYSKSIFTQITDYNTGKITNKKFICTAADYLNRLQKAGEQNE